MTGIGSIGYFEDFNDFDVFDDFAYYWFTPYQYIKWRQELYGKTMKEAHHEFVWLRNVHQLVQCTEGEERFFLISVNTVEAFKPCPKRDIASLG